MTTTTIHLPTKSLLWMSDIHLDKATEATRRQFMNHLQIAPFETVLITGDISTSHCLQDHLTEISKACGSRPIIFTLGNHDYFKSSFAAVDQVVDDVCKRHPNLIALGKGEVIQLSPNTALVGHRGWFDGQAGSGAKTKVESPDRYQILDFQHLDRRGYFKRLAVLGQESSEYFRNVLPVALSRYSKVLLATHVPPFTQAVRYDNKGCLWNRQPYFCNTALGKFLVEFAKHNSKRRIEVYAGHTHSAVSIKLKSNLFAHVAAATPGHPANGQLLTIS